MPTNKYVLFLFICTLFVFVFVVENKHISKQKTYSLVFAHFVGIFHHCAKISIMMLQIVGIGSGISGRDRIVVSTSRCGRDNPGSNPGHGMPALLPLHNGPSYLFVVVVVQNKAGKADTFHFLKLAHIMEDDFFYV